MSKKHIFIILGFLLLFFVGIIGFQFVKTIQRTASTKIEPISLETIADGTYEGESDFGLVQVGVEVQVERHKIKNIWIRKHQNGLGKAAEAIVFDMIEENRIDVDVVSGASVSSKAIQKACEQALKK